MARHLLSANKLGGYGAHDLGDKARTRAALADTPALNRPPQKPTCSLCGPVSLHARKR